MPSTIDSDWWNSGIQDAIASLERDGGIEHARVLEWVESWDTEAELPEPKP